MTGPAPIDCLHHLAFVTADTAATVDFYQGVLGLPLVNAVMDAEVPSTKAPFPYIHVFFRLASGETLAFFESPDLQERPAERLPGYEDFEHLALSVRSRDDVDRWRAELTARGLDVVANDHGIIYSIYFRDPVNDIRLEITTTIDPTWNDQAERANEAVAAWTRTRNSAADAGEDVSQALRDLARTRRPGA
jgi:catechol 2,3-dioxygenase-like lactoylglutathione lyase family enzyme